MMNDSGIYKIINRINGKFYLGGTFSFVRRFKEHKKSLNQGTHHSVYLQRAWNKYGERAFIFRPIFICSKEDIDFYEQQYFDEVTPYENNVGYNMNCEIDSRLGRSMSLQARRKMSIAKKGKPSNHKGIKATKETRRKLSESHKGQKAWNKGKTGIYSEETKKKMGLHNIGRPAWGNGIKGSTPWNKGLTKKTDKRIAEMADSKEINLNKSIAVKKWWKLRKQEYVESQ